MDREVDGGKKISGLGGITGERIWLGCGANSGICGGLLGRELNVLGVLYRVAGSGNRMGRIRDWFSMYAASSVLRRLYLSRFLGLFLWGFKLQLNYFWWSTSCNLRHRFDW